MLSKNGIKPALRVVVLLCFTGGVVRSQNFSLPDGCLSQGGTGRAARACQRLRAGVRLWELTGLLHSALLPLANEAKRVGGLRSQIGVDKGKHSSHCKDIKIHFNKAGKGRAGRCDWMPKP